MFLAAPILLGGGVQDKHFGIFEKVKKTINNMLLWRCTIAVVNTSDFRSEDQKFGGLRLNKFDLVSKLPCSFFSSLLVIKHGQF